MTLTTAIVALEGCQVCGLALALAFAFSTLSIRIWCRSAIIRGVSHALTIVAFPAAATFFGRVAPTSTIVALHGACAFRLRGATFLCWVATTAANKAFQLFGVPCPPIHCGTIAHHMTITFAAIATCP